MTWISKYNIAVVTGCSGAGKSFLIHHVALELHRKNKYDIIPLSFVTAPSDIMKYNSKNRKQVFVIDDVCGRETINVQLVNTWKQLTEKLNDIFKSNCTDSNLLISCRLQECNDSQFKGLTQFTENVFDIVSAPLCLLPEERMFMIKKYLETDNIDHVINDLLHFDFFPLLCKMSKNVSKEKLTIEYGHYLMECFIKYANEGLIGELYIFKSIETNLTDDFVVLPEEMEERYFERLLDDLKQWDIYSTLHNNQLVHKSFRTKLIRYLQHNEKDLKKVFNQMDKDGIKLLTWEIHYFMYYAFDDDHARVDVTFPLIEAAIEGYADIVEFLIKMNCDVNKKTVFIEQHYIKHVKVVIKML
ncbi:unnamed protein product [Mytilus edulis]|uniref:Novel STAND NTPase 3 domain-containing protein n=1 Tax=Mytilus edulis TaxID=6550 RepID=A0A8S3V1S8_MYTED|nr:unnamed protein product [Mytilus edulis]